MNIQGVFAENMRRYRKETNLTQESLAARAGLHRTYVGGIEQRHVNVSIKNVGRLADALGVDPALLFLRDDVVMAEYEPRRARATKQDNQDDGAPHHDDTVALCIWSDGEATIRPIESHRPDLTIHVLVELINQGYTGDALVQRYHDVYAEIDRFLDEGQ